MRIWIDLANSPHVPFFRALIPEFVARGHQVEITARDFAQTVELATKAGMLPHVIGGHGGRSITGKAGNLVGRAAALRKWARDRGFDLAVSHNSYAQIAAAAALRIKTVTLMDYEHQPANHLAFRLASRVIVPRAFPAVELRKYGASMRKVKRYDGTKEDVYLADFTPELLTRLNARARVKTILLPRMDAQRDDYNAEKFGNVIMPRAALDGANLIAAADQVISAGGTMNREAAALGVPAASVYAGKWAAVDEELVREGRLQRISSRDDIESLKSTKKAGTNARHATGVRNEVIRLILEE